MTATNANIPVLDHGYVRFIESWGRGEANEPEAGIVEAARQSTQGSFRGWDQDERLLTYLYTAKPAHATPFEFAGAIIEVQAPIFVFREWHRHRTQSYNEASARYAPLPNLNYVPTVDRLLRDANGANKQAGKVRGSGVLDEVGARAYQRALAAQYDAAEVLYQRALADGVPKELARVHLPVGRYSRMRASVNLRNWLAFMTLRADPAAQWEIQQFAGVVGQVLDAQFPRTMNLFWSSRPTTEDKP